MRAFGAFSEIGGGARRWGWRGAYQQVHWEALAAGSGTHCDLPWALDTARAWGRGGGVGEEKKKGLSVSYWCLDVIRVGSISVVAVYPSAAQGGAVGSCCHPHDLRPKHSN